MGTSKLIAVTFFAWLAVVYFEAVTPSAQQEPAPAQIGAYKPPPAPEQPLPYSHKVHLAQGLKCAGCHEGAEKDDHANLPRTQICMGCHTNVKTDSLHIQKLAQYDQKKEDVPWRRVYRLPSFVYWSHKQHVTDGKITCDTCHGDVAQMDVMQKVKDMSMAACMDCHKQHSAPVTCDTCHDPQ